MTRIIMEPGVPLSIREFLRLSAHLQLLPVLESGEETLVGGQAVMEGVMMRAPHSYCVAVRRPSGEIVTEERPIHRMSEKYPIFGIPFLRGIGTLGQAMTLGVKALRFSADAAVDDGQTSAGETKSKEIPGWVMALNIAFSLGFFILLYKFIPFYVTKLLGQSYPALSGNVAFSLVEGSIRIAIFLAFLWTISRWKDIHRVFEYHGAEHKVVFNYESGTPVNIENAASFPTWHPRCGTSFLIVVMLISMIVYMFVPAKSFGMQFLSRILLLPVIAGISYEVIRYAARRQKNLMSLLTAPGLWLQRITTQAPSDQQSAVAIRALEGAMALEEKQGGQLVIA